MTEVIEADLLVVGGGIAGLSAAAMAAASGLRVVVAEKAGYTGGSAALSGAFVWRLNSMDVYRREVPEGSPLLAQVLLDEFERAIDWVRSLGVHVAPPVSPRPIPFGTGHLIDVLAYLRECGRIVERRRGIVRCDTTTERLLVRGGAVLGAVVRDRDGVVEIRASGTVLATGGFRSDQALRAQYIAGHADEMLVRSNPHSSGDGLRLGVAAGGRTTADMAGLYGHLICSPLDREFVPGDYVRLAQSVYSQHGVLLDRSGASLRRRVPRLLPERAGAHAAAGCPLPVIADEAIRLEHATQAPTQGMETIDLVTEAERAGANVARASSVDELAALVAAWGYDAAVVAASIRAFNDQVLVNPDAMDPPRERARAPLEPPYFAVECQPAITFTHGGLRIDAHARVLGEGDRPVPGLYAAGTDGAGVNNVGYAGGLSVGLVFGLRAVDELASAR